MSDGSFCHYCGRATCACPSSLDLTDINTVARFAGLKPQEPVGHTVPSPQTNVTFLTIPLIAEKLREIGKRVSENDEDSGFDLAAYADHLDALWEQAELAPSLDVDSDLQKPVPSPQVPIGLQREIEATVALDGGTRRACNQCDNDWPCKDHPAPAEEAGARETAVFIVDVCKGYTIEFSDNPSWHGELYDVAEKKIAAYAASQTAQLRQQVASLTAQLETEKKEGDHSICNKVTVRTISRIHELADERDALKQELSLLKGGSQ